MNDAAWMRHLIETVRMGEMSEPETWLGRKRETSEEWLERHRIPMQDGKYVFYHATPARGGAKTFVRKGSYLEDDPKSAVHFAGRDRDLKPNQIHLHKLLLSADEIEPGMFPKLMIDYPIDRGTRAKI